MTEQNETPPSSPTSVLRQETVPNLRNRRFSTWIPVNQFEKIIGKRLKGEQEEEEKKKKVQVENLAPTLWDQLCSRQTFSCIAERLKARSSNKFAAMQNVEDSFSLARARCSCLRKPYIAWCSVGLDCGAAARKCGNFLDKRIRGEWGRSESALRTGRKKLGIKRKLRK